MPIGHQLSINCGLKGDFTCELQEQSLPAIIIQAQQVPAQYNYYLLINNLLQKSCQLSLKAQIDQETEQIPWSNTFVKLFYQNQQLFDGSLAEFFKQKISLLNLAAHSSKLYRLEFYLTELGNEFNLDFSLNFLFNCQTKSIGETVEQEILGVQIEQQDFQALEPIKSIAIDESLLIKQRLFLITALFIFLLCLGLIFCFYRSKFSKNKKILISSKKGKIYEQK